MTIMTISTRYYNACIQAFKEHINYDKIDDEAKKKIDKELNQVPIDDGEIRLFIKEKIKDPDRRDLFFKKVKESCKQKDYKDEQQDTAQSFLEENRPRFQSLGCGFHRGQYYFGTKLWRDGRGFSAIVTDKKLIFINKRERFGKEWMGDNEIKSKFGLNYKDEFYDEALDHLFRNEAIKIFISDGARNINFTNTFDKLVIQLKKYMYFEDKTKYKAIALYRIAGFFMHVWGARARLFILAEYGSSKSRLAKILHNTGFNSVSLGDWTLPFLQRMIESTRGEAHIDDFESLDDEKKKATIRLVKTGYMKGFKAGKTSDRSRRPEVYDLFNTTTINNTEGLDFISYDRCMNIRIPKISKEEYDIEPKFDEAIWQELRDELYILGLKEAKRVSEVYPKIKSDHIRGRLLSIVKPELTIATLISKDLFNEVESWWKQEIEQRDTRELIDDWEFRALERIYDMVVRNDNQDFFVLYDDIIKHLIFDMYGESELRKYKFKMSSRIGASLARSPIFKKRVVNGKTQYKVQKNRFIELLRAKRLLKYIENYDSTNSIDSTTSTVSTHSTKSDGVESVGGVESGSHVETTEKSVLDWDTRCLVHARCQATNCDEWLCNEGSSGKYYCKRHLK